MVNVPTSLNNFLKKVNDLDVGRSKTILVDLKKLSDVVDNEVVKNRKFNTLKLEVNNLENKFLDKTTLIHINQYNTGKQNLEKKIEDVDKKIPETSKSVTAIVLNTRISEVENKIRDTSSLVTTNVFKTKISEVENKISNHDKYITTQEFNKLMTEYFAWR